MPRPAEPAADRAHAHLRAEILSGRLTPGTMLSESEIAASLAMSRTPVRAALLKLQEEGWVTIYPQRGALVRHLSDDEVRESAQVRNALESAGVQGSTQGSRAERRAWLQNNLHDQQAALQAEDFAGFRSLAMRFHRAFVEIGGNSVMLGVYDRLQDWQALSIIRSSQRILADPDLVIAEHRQLLTDALDGDWISFTSHLSHHQHRSHGLEP